MASFYADIHEWTLPEDKLQIYLKVHEPVYHNEGKFIAVPYGSGVEFFIDQLQFTKYNNWDAVDRKTFLHAEPILWAVGAAPPKNILEYTDHSGGLDMNLNIDEICRRADITMKRCKQLGLWVMGELWMEPQHIDAVVILPVKIHKELLVTEYNQTDAWFYEREIIPYIDNRLMPAIKQYSLAQFPLIETACKWIIDNQLIHTMSITKAAVGLMYQVNRFRYRRDHFIKFNEKIATTLGQALNMMSGYGDNQWDYNEYRRHVENNKDLLEYSKDKLTVAKKVNTYEYNNLMYQVLASLMPDIIDQFGVFMGDKPSVRLAEYDYKGDTVYFRHGTGWKWEVTASNEALGPHGLHMSPYCARKFARLAAPHVMSSQKDRNNIQGFGWSNHKTQSKIKQYWNGWQFTNQCAYAIGHVCQIIAITPSGPKIQLYDEQWDDEGHGLDKESEHSNEKWFFIDNIERELQFRRGGVYKENFNPKYKF